MPVTITQILVQGTASPKDQPVTITDQATSAVLATGMPDPGTGAFSIPVPFGLYLQAQAAGQASGAGGVPGSQAGVAAGGGGATGALGVAQHLTGEADGKASDSASPTKQLAGTAAGAATGGAGAPSIVGGSNLQGRADGAGGGSATPQPMNVSLTGGAGGKATGGPSVQAQAEPIAAAGAGTGGASGTVAAGGGPLFSDTFTAANGSAPDAGKWTVISGANEQGTSAVTVQANALQVSSGTTNAPTYASKGVVSVPITGTQHAFQVDVTALDGTANSFTDVSAIYNAGNYAPNTDGVPTKNNIYVRFTSATHADVFWVDGGGATSLVGSVTFSAGAPYRVVITIPTSGAVTVSVNGVSAGAFTYYDIGLDTNVALTTSSLVLGTQSKLYMAVTCKTATLLTSSFDSVQVT